MRRLQRFNDFIRDRREQLDLSQDDMAAHLGVSQPIVSAWEISHRTPRPKRRILPPERAPAVVQFLQLDDAAEFWRLYGEARAEDAEDANRATKVAERRASSAEDDAAAVSAATRTMIEKFERFANQYEELGHSYGRMERVVDSISENVLRLVELNTQLIEQLLKQSAPRSPRKDPPSS